MPAETATPAVTAVQVTKNEQRDEALVLLEYMLLKKTESSMVSAWQKRYCVLKSDGKLEMYQNKSYFEEERMPRKVLKLRHYSKCANSEDIHAAVGKYPFTIFPIDNETDSEGNKIREFHFISDDRDMRRKWKSVLQKQIDIFNGTHKRESAIKSQTKGFSTM